MNQIELLFLNVLNWKPEQIQSIHSFRDENSELFISVVPKSTTRVCPCCGSKKIVSKGYRHKTIKSSTSNIETCTIMFSIKRYTCKSYNKSFSDEFHISPDSSRLSIY